MSKAKQPKKTKKPVTHQQAGELCQIVHKGKPLELEEIVSMAINMGCNVQITLVPKTERKES